MFVNMALAEAALPAIREAAAAHAGEVGGGSNNHSGESGVVGPFLASGSRDKTIKVSISPTFLSSQSC